MSVEQDLLDRTQSTVDNFAVANGLDDKMEHLGKDNTVLNEYESYYGLLDPAFDRRLNLISLSHRFGKGILKFINSSVESLGNHPVIEVVESSGKRSV